jgi:hypothetical protein
MSGNGGNGSGSIIMTSPAEEIGARGEAMLPDGAVSGLGMTEFVRSYMNGSGEQWPDVAILRPAGRPIPLKRGEEGAAESAFVEMDVGELKDGGVYDVRKIKVPFECYNYTGLDKKTYIKLMDYVCTDLDGRSLCDRYGSGRKNVLVFDVL